MIPFRYLTPFEGFLISLALKSVTSFEDDAPRHIYPRLRTSMTMPELDSLYLLSLPNLTALHVGAEVDRDVDVYLPLLPSTVDLIRRSHCCLSIISLNKELWTMRPSASFLHSRRFSRS
ncbi:hypothetical protein BDZ89DRAFT_571118 [Hymenopellis radicata]|nr:hypothetical protein BDZ89DRAFT_571118 [Hymenopellis radicata]